jgi:hypothetical protein
VHVTMNTVHNASICRTPLEATKEATRRSTAAGGGRLMIDDLGGVEA